MVQRYITCGRFKVSEIFSEQTIGQSANIRTHINIAEKYSKRHLLVVNIKSRKKCIQEHYTLSSMLLQAI